VRSFDTWISQTYSNELVQFLSGLKYGVLVLISVKDEAQRNLTINAKKALKDQLGSTMIDSLRYRYSWCIIGRKGTATAISEDHQASGEASCNNQLYRYFQPEIHYNDLPLIQIKSTGFNVGNSASIKVGEIETLKPAKRGLNVVVMGDDGSIISVRSFDTWISQTYSNELIQFLSELKDGVLVLISVKDEAQRNLTGNAKKTLKDQLGSTMIYSLGYRQSWCIIGRKGTATAISEDHQASGEASCNNQLNRYSRGVNAVYIKSARWGTFLRFNSNRDVDLSTAKSSSEEIILQKLDGDIYAIKSATHANMYLRFGGSGADEVVNTQTAPGPWERFYIEILDNGKVAFKNVQFGNYLRARDNRDLDTQTYIGSSEQFHIIKSSDDSPWHPICNKMEVRFLNAFIDFFKSNQLSLSKLTL
jgi:arsenate reductase-like glutaredoxin family protein